jgi:hypothetical protein
MRSCPDPCGVFLSPFRRMNGITTSDLTREVIQSNHIGEFRSEDYTGR